MYSLKLNLVVKISQAWPLSFPLFSLRLWSARPIHKTPESSVISTGKYWLTLGLERNMESHPLHSEEKGTFPPGWKTLQGTLYHSLMSFSQSAFRNNCQSL